MENKKLIYREDLIAEYDRVHKGPAGGARKLMIGAPAVDALIIPEGGVGEASDGYHTFNELYHHRAVLFSVICNANHDKAWKSKLHDTGDMFEGMFIVGIETPQGQATYHYDIEPYWDMFKVKELERAPKWDGHTPEQAIERIGTMCDFIKVLNLKGEENMDANKNNTLKVLEALKTVEFTETKESIRWVCEIDGKTYGSYMPNSEGVNTADAITAFMPQIAGTIEGVICGVPE